MQIAIKYLYDRYSFVINYITLHFIII